MRKFLPILVVGILVLSGLGAVALDKDIEKLDSDVINYKKTNDEKRDFTHTVLGEFGTATWCGFCHYAHTALKNIYASGDFPFYYVSLVRDKNVGVCNPRLFGELNLYGFPTLYFDGGDEVVVGGYTGVENDHRAAINSCGNRVVYDVDIGLTVIWLGGTEMEIDVSVDNNEGSTYDGTIRVYITEIVSSMNWKDTTGQLYTFPLLDFAFKDDGTGKDISIPAGSTWSDSTIWDGSDHGFPGITMDNIMVIAAVFNDEWHQGYAYPPSSNPFDAYYVDETVAALVETNQPPGKTTVSGPIVVDPDVEYEYSFVATDPNDDDLRYYIDWGDITEAWLGPSPSGEPFYVNHSWSENGTYEVKAKARDEKFQEGPWSDTLTVMVGNLAPEKPEISGITKGKIGNEYEYTFVSTDPNGDQLSYYIKWGDETVTDWTTPQASGTPYSEKHTWDVEDHYRIEAKAKDTDGAESDWAELVVIMPRNRAINTPFFKFLQNYQNLFQILRLLLHLY